MSNFLNLGYSSLNDLVTIHATDITSETLTTNKINANDIVLSGTIQNGSNVISFNEQYQFVDVNHNMHCFGNFLLDYQNQTYNVGQMLLQGGGGGGGNPYPSITYDSATGVTTFSGPLDFQSQSISSNAIINEDTFMTISGGIQNVSSSKIYSTQQHFQSNIRLDAALLLSNGNTTISNSELSTLSGISSNIQTQLSNRVSKTGIETISDVKTFSSPPVMSGASISSGSIPITSVSGTACNLSSAQTLAGQKSFSSSPLFLANCLLNGSLLLNNNTLTVTNAQLQRIPDIGTLNTKTTNISFVSNTTSVSNSLSSSVFTFSSSINGFSSANFNNAIDFSRTLTSDSQSQHDATLAIATPALAASTANTAALAVITTTTLPAMSLLITGNTNGIAANTESINTLNQKTTGISYNNTTSITSIASTCSLNTLRLTTLNSGLTQDENQPVVFIGQTRFRNGVRISDGFGFDVSGNGDFGGSLTSNAGFTCNGTNANINTTNLTVNALSTVNNDMTIASTKKLVLKNIVPHNLDNIFIGGETAAYSTYTTNFNTKAVFNEPLNTYSSVNFGTNAFRNSLTSYNDTFSVDATTSATLTSASIAVNAPTVNIGTNQGIGAANSITLGSLSSISFINLNGIVNAPLGITTSSIFSQW
jgi:hypothetical protein